MKNKNFIIGFREAFILTVMKDIGRGPAHQINHEVEQRLGPDRNETEGNCAPTLVILRKRGLCRTVEATGDDSARLAYEITPAGEDALGKWARVTGRFLARVGV